MTALVAVATIAFSAVAQAELADPTRPPAHGVAQPLPDSEEEPGLRLTSILISPSRRLAIINGQLVAPGDPVAGFTVHEIGTSSVTLRGASGPQQVHLVPPAIKRLRPQDEKRP
jgi:MSHA biogenesis protein MshK